MRIIQTKEDYITGRDKVLERTVYGILLDEGNARLEDMPEVLAKAFGRLIEKLWDKGLLKDDEVKEILDIQWEYPAYELKGDN